MDDRSRAPTWDAPAPLCATCQNIFRGTGRVKQQATLFKQPQVASIDPSACNICLIINDAAISRSWKLSDVTQVSYEFSVWNSFHELNLHLYAKDLPAIRFSRFLPEKAGIPYQAYKLPDDATRLDAAMSFAIPQLATCLNEHSLCKQQLGARTDWYPTRLLEIQRGDQNLVYLRNRDEVDSGSYCSLSHCWGNVRPVVLTAQTENQLRAGYPLDKLPKTFKEAVIVASKLSVRYIWIDSMCIFQDPDNLQDWAREAAAMRDVYMNAICNIAATGSGDDLGGLFLPETPTSKADIPFCVNLDVVLQDFEWMYQSPQLRGLYRLARADYWKAAVDCGVLNSRAWVMQERFLSRRILHFAGSEVLWECLESRSSESFPNSIPAQIMPPIEDESQRLKRVLFELDIKGQGQRHSESLFRSWQTFVKSYSGCNLTNDGDKLVAIRGIQNLLNQTHGIEFVAGCWLSKMLQELCWYTVASRPKKSRLPKKWRAPTWSWASKNGPIDSVPIVTHFTCPEVSIMASVESIHVDEAESGQVRDASLTLRGKLLFGKLVETRLSGIHEDGKRWGKFSLRCGSTIIEGRTFTFWPDDGGDIDYTRGEDVVCLAILSCGCSKTGGYKRKWLTALVLKKTVGLFPLKRPSVSVSASIPGPLYERIGITFFQNALCTMYEAQEADTEESIVIV